MKNLNQKQNPERHSREEHLGDRQDCLIEMIRLIQQLQVVDTLSRERFREKIQEFKNRILTMNYGKTENLFAGQNKDYLIKIIKNIG
jgi:TnpA family transposase